MTTKPDSAPEVALCMRCNRDIRDSEDQAEWNAAMSDGRVVGFVCPDCQTPEENAEAVVRDASRQAPGSVQWGNGETWFDLDPNRPPRAGEWVPVYRNGGPRDGMRVGTAHCDGKALSVVWQVDEHGNPLPGFAEGAKG